MIKIQYMSLFIIVLYVWYNSYEGIKMQTATQTRTKQAHYIRLFGGLFDV